jgi:hypothetical protein
MGTMIEAMSQFELAPLNKLCCSKPAEVIGRQRSHWFRNPLEPYHNLEFILGLEALLNSLSFLAPRGSGRDALLRITQAAIMNQSLTKQNTISAEIVLDCFDYQSDRNCTARMVPAENPIGDYNVSSNREGY